MRKSLLALPSAAALVLVSSIHVFASPVVGHGGVLRALEDASIVEQARVFCYNRYTGRFLHWGRCARRHVRHHARPRVYCYNRRTGRFLHWGHC
ncbi:MAG: hypothetical protein AB7F41_14980 [Methylocystis sp.]|uniref:hypothetical protein n=1 Tax=Methylocystis sp. TaxID=1911079 RepID=UPI003D09738B